MRDAIDFASTGSELLTGLRYHLHQAAAATDLPGDLRAAATELAEAIHAVLVR